LLPIAEIGDLIFSNFGVIKKYVQHNFKFSIFENFITVCDSYQQMSEKIENNSSAQSKSIVSK
jgi:hypothetical protein